LTGDPGDGLGRRWCPSCGQGWPAGTAACHECFVELVDDPKATIRCRHCGQEWPARMKSCPNCLAELRLDPERAGQALAATLVRGFYLARPEGAVAFEQGPACTLLRARPQASLVFIGDEGFLEAQVDGRDHRAVPPLACLDLDGRVLFRLTHYQAADDALVAFGGDGASIGTYLRRPGVLRPVIDVRDETSAPVAQLRSGKGSTDGGFDLVQTRGAAVARVVRADVDMEGWVDDQWSFRPLVDDARLPLRPLAAVALLLAAKVLLGRATPARPQRQEHLSWDDLEED